MTEFPGIARAAAAVSALSKISTRNAAYDWARSHFAYCQVSLPAGSPIWALAAEAAAGEHFSATRCAIAAGNAAHQHFDATDPAIVETVRAERRAIQAAEDAYSRRHSTDGAFSK